MTKVFDFISHHGRRVADNRALRNHPDYASRERRRKEGGRGNTMVMSDNLPNSDLTVHSFFDDITLVHQYNPWWYKVAVRIHRWLSDHGPRAQWRALKIYHQRGKRGWADCDIWNLDHTLSHLIRDMVLELKRIQHGYPGNLSPAQWNTILDEIADGMQAHLEMKHDNTTHPVNEARRDLAFDHLKEHWGSLWD